MGQKNTFWDHFFLEEGLTEERLVGKFGKNGGKNYHKKSDQKIVSSDTRRPPDGRTQKFKSAFKHSRRVGWRQT